MQYPDKADDPVTSVLGPADPGGHPPVDFGTQDSMAGERPVNFGEQVIAKGGLPKDLETRIEKIHKGE